MTIAEREECVCGAWMAPVDGEPGKWWCPVCFRTMIDHYIVGGKS